ncbi:N-acetyltransferase [Pseudoalteromonas piscicida]
MKKEIHEFNEQLNNHLKARFNYKRRVSEVCVLDNRIHAWNKKVNLYIRYKPNYKPYLPNTLVLARIGFYQSRKGHGTDLLKFLKAHSTQYGIEHIALESVNENSKAFCKASGFEEVANDVWSIPVAKIQLPEPEITE